MNQDLIAYTSSERKPCLAPDAPLAVWMRERVYRLAEEHMSMYTADALLKMMRGGVVLDRRVLSRSRDWLNDDRTVFRAIRADIHAQIPNVPRVRDAFVRLARMVCFEELTWTWFPMPAEARLVAFGRVFGLDAPENPRKRARDI